MIKHQQIKKCLDLHLRTYCWNLFPEDNLNCKFKSEFPCRRRRQRRNKEKNVQGVELNSIQFNSNEQSLNKNCYSKFLLLLEYVYLYLSICTH